MSRLRRTPRCQAASLMAPVRLVGVVGSDFDEAHLVMLRGIDHFRATAEFDCIDAALEFVEAVPPPAS